MRHTLHKNLLMVLISLLFLGCGAIHEDNRFDQSNPLPSIENPENNDSNDNAPEDEDDDNNPPPNEVIVANVTWQFLMNNVWNKAEYSCLECHGGGETSGGLNMDMHRILSMEIVSIKKWPWMHLLEEAIACPLVETKTFLMKI